MTAIPHNHSKRCRTCGVYKALAVLLLAVIVVLLVYRAPRAASDQHAVPAAVVITEPSPRRSGAADDKPRPADSPVDEEAGEKPFINNAAFALLLRGNRTPVLTTGARLGKSFRECAELAGLSPEKLAALQEIITLHSSKLEELEMRAAWVDESPAGEEIVIPKLDLSAFRTELESRMNGLLGDERLVQALTKNLEYSTEFNLLGTEKRMYYIESETMPRVSVSHTVRRAESDSVHNDPDDDFSGLVFSQYITLRSEIPLSESFQSRRIFEQSSSLPRKGGAPR